MIKEKYSFREATIDDLSLVFNWANELMQHESLDKSIELPLVDDINNLLQDWVKNLISDNNSLIIIVSDETKSNAVPLGFIAGLLQLQPNNFTSYIMHGVIQMVWVIPEQRNKGLAMQLVNYMEDTFNNLNVPYCEIQYSNSNNEAAVFWEKAGYQTISHSCRKRLE